MSAIAAAVSAGFAILAWVLRTLDSKRFAKRDSVHSLLDALQAVSRDAFASRYAGPNDLHASKKRLGALAQGAGFPVPATMAVADARSDTEIEQLEQAAFDELAALLRES